MPGSEPKHVALDLDPALLAEARTLDLDVRHAAEEGILRAIHMVRWARDNAEVVQSTNAFVEAKGLPLRRYRSF